MLELSSGNDPRFSKANSFEMSAKALGHELKSFSAIEDAESPSLVFPLLALFDFRGLRLAAYCSPPIDESTFRYGNFFFFFLFFRKIICC